MNEDQIASTRTEIAKKEDQIAKKEDQIANIRTEIANIRTEIAKKEDQITRKRDELDALLARETSGALVTSSRDSIAFLTASRQTLVDSMKLLQDSITSLEKQRDILFAECEPSTI